MNKHEPTRNHTQPRKQQQQPHDPTKKTTSMTTTFCPPPNRTAKDSTTNTKFYPNAPSAAVPLACMCIHRHSLKTHQIWTTTTTTTNKSNQTKTKKRVAHSFSSDGRKTKCASSLRHCRPLSEPAMRGRGGGFRVCCLRGVGAGGADKSKWEG